MKNKFYLFYDIEKFLGKMLYIILLTANQLMQKNIKFEQYFYQYESAAWGTFSAHKQKTFSMLLQCISTGENVLRKFILKFIND